MNTMTNDSRYSRNTQFMRSINAGRALVRPKDMTKITGRKGCLWDIFIPVPNLMIPEMKITL